jgi:hypothetical protein
MNRSRRRYVLAWLVLVTLLMPGLAEPRASGDEKQAEKKWYTDRAITVSPAEVPWPALKYRLFPLSSERKDGNAVPIYLRLNCEQNDEARKLLYEKPDEWNKLPLDKIPLDEANKFIRGFARFYQQFDLGARRKTADWSYTIDQGDVMELAMPDAQQIRNYVPMLVLKVRVEAAEKNFPAAVHSLETGLSFGQQIGEAPFLVSALVAFATANKFADVLPDVLELPDAPSLYWALTVIPRPLVDLRKAMDFEQRVLEMQFPEFADLARLRPPEEWDTMLRRIRTEVRRISDAAGLQIPKLSDRGPDDAASKSPDLPAAKQYLIDRAGMKAATVDAMPPAQILVLCMARYAREVYDDHFKAYFLPYPQARVEASAADRRVKANLESTPYPHSETARFIQAVLPLAIKVQAAQSRLERKLAMLRVVDALRLHARAHGGDLPDRLDQITVVPIPDDPGTDNPFEYERQGATATLTSRIPDESVESSGLRYRITMRK